MNIDDIISQYTNIMISLWAHSNKGPQKEKEEIRDIFAAFAKQILRIHEN